MTDQFTAQAVIVDAGIRAKFDKDLGTVRTIVLKVEIPEPRGMKDALVATMRDIAGLVGEGIVLRGATVQVRLALDQEAPAAKAGAP